MNSINKDFNSIITEKIMESFNRVIVLTPYPKFWWELFSNIEENIASQLYDQLKNNI